MTISQANIGAATPAVVQPALVKVDEDAKPDSFHLGSGASGNVRAPEPRKSLNARVADLLRPHLQPGQKVIWREAFRHLGQGGGNNLYECWDEAIHAYATAYALAAIACQGDAKHLAFCDAVFEASNQPCFGAWLVGLAGRALTDCTVDERSAWLKGVAIRAKDAKL